MKLWRMLIDALAAVRRTYVQWLAARLVSLAGALVERRSNQ
jgi:hypothetical protein